MSKIAVLSNVTAASLAARTADRTGLEVFTPGGYNTWVQELANPGSDLYKGYKSYKKGAKAAFIILHGSALLGGEALESRENAESILSPLAETISDAARNHEDMTFAVSTLDIPQRRITPLQHERAELHASSFWRGRMEEFGIPLIELSEIAANMGRANFYNDRVWYMGSMPFSQKGEAALAGEIRRIWSAIAGRRKKCLALDLDNTLWGGVIGEAGAAGIELGSAGPAARYYDFQKRILDLKRQGVLLALLSKNNMDDAMAGIREHPSMLLREDDFVAIRADWNPKPDNLASVAEELNIGIDSFVFIDDNPVERETMKVMQPDVTVPDFPEDTSQLEKFIIDLAREHFLLLRTTGEDTAKTEQYRAENARKKQRSSYSSVADYLASLEMVLSIENLDARNLPRAAQLTQKTNQFNLTARRYSEPDMQTMLGDPRVIIRIGELKDRFGDYGKVVLCIAEISPDGASANIDTFLMSCRAMGREVESTFLRAVENELHSKGIRKITAEYIPTGKNSVVSDFWDRMGYVRGEIGQYSRDISSEGKNAAKHKKTDIIRTEKQ